jgi:hypothetical protein
VEAKVAKVVDDYTLVLNAGSEHGVSIGQRFLIYAIGEEILDPDTEESLGQLEIVKGTGKVTHVQERICTISSDMKASAGRTVRRTGSSPLAAIQLFGKQEIEEILPAEKVSFEDPEKGDLAKRV